MIVIYNNHCSVWNNSRIIPVNLFSYQNLVFEFNEKDASVKNVIFSIKFFISLFIETVNGNSFTLK
jgi:hypothetical protein